MDEHRDATRALGPSGWGFSGSHPSRPAAATTGAAAVVAAVPSGAGTAGLPGQLSTPQLSFPFFPCLLFPVAFPFFPASPVNEKKVRQQRTQGNFLLLILPFQEREVAPPTSLHFLPFLIFSSSTLFVGLMGGCALLPLPLCSTLVGTEQAEALGHWLRPWSSFSFPSMAPHVLRAASGSPLLRVA